MTEQPTQQEILAELKKEIDELYSHHDGLRKAWQKIDDIGHVLKVPYRMGFAQPIYDVWDLMAKRQHRVTEMLLKLEASNANQ